MGVGEGSPTKINYRRKLAPLLQPHTEKRRGKLREVAVGENEAPGIGPQGFKSSIPET